MKPLHADCALSARIERSVVADLARYAEACARLDPNLSVATEHHAGGLALYVAPGSPVNMLFGAGLAGIVDASELDAVEHFFAERSTGAAISLSPLADESLVTLLGMRGWMLTDFENVLVRPLAGGEAALELPEPAPDVSVRVASSPADRELWASVSAEAFSAPDEPSAEVRRLAQAARVRDDMVLLLAAVEGQEAGTGALWIDDGLGWMLADATLPHLRGRGVQTALLAERTRMAARAGCEYAVTEARPGSISQRNMERLGYSVVYTRVEMIAPPKR